MNAFSKTLAGGVAFTLLLAGSAQAKPTDRNHDGLPDRWERTHHLSLRLDQARRDQDHDGLNNRGEYRAGFDPRDRDSDDDGVSDGRANAGSVTAYKDGLLTVALAKGGTLTAKVTDATRVECASSGRASVSASGGDETGGYYGGGATTPADDHGGHGGEAGDDNGGHGTEPGDDNGGHGTEPGDDNGGHGTEPGDDHGGHGSDDTGGYYGNGGTTAPAGATNTPSGTTAPAGNSRCAIAVGAKVREAELKARGGVAVWKELKLL